jgi:hypothetical protein
MRARLLVAMGLLAAHVAAARPPLCGQGRFVSDVAPLLGGDDSPAGADIVLADGQVRLGGTCAPTTARLARAARGTMLRARWAVCGTVRGVRLRATIDARCAALRGIVRTRHPRGRTRVTASCRDGCSLPGAFACLAGDGALRTLAGSYADRVSALTLPAGARIDARLGTFLASPANRYPILLGGGAGVCFAGGTVRGGYDRGLDWEAMHQVNNAGIRIESAGTIVDGIRIDDVTDGIRPVGPDFTIRAAWLSWVRDDCVENDHLQGGLIEDSLFDGCYVGVSERPSPSITRSGADGRGQTLTIRGSLIRLEPMPGPRNGAPGDRGHGQFFKWHDAATALALHDDVFLAEQVGQGGADTMGIPGSLTGCSNNVMVWLGSGPYPAPLPQCFIVRRDRAVWDGAVAAWRQRHPEVGASSHE